VFISKAIILWVVKDFMYFCARNRPTAGVTGKGGIWRTKPPDAESAVGAASLKVRRNARTCPVHAVLAGILPIKNFAGIIQQNFQIEKLSP
jgi:hypothetical protein